MGVGEEAVSAQTRERIVVVGGGLAGLETLVALRKRGHRGALTLVSAESHRPYDRPPLSKEVLRGERADSFLEADWDTLAVDLRLGCEATGLADGVLETDKGRLDFDGLVLATGSTPIALPQTSAAPKVHTLRTIDDAHALRAAFSRGARVVIVGAGWIGAEVATAASQAGCVVAVVEKGEAPLSGALPPAVGRLTRRWYAEAQIDLRLGVAVAAIADGAVHLADGTSLVADCVVIGVGVRPQTSWLADSGLDLTARGHVRTDGRLRASLPGVVAVGDCAEWDSAMFGEPLHVEHWDNALRAPAVAAANLLGGAESYDPVPYFWSEQFGRMVQYVGHHRGADELLLRGDPSGEAWSACWTREGQLLATLSVGRPRDIGYARRVIAGRSPVDSEKLRDASIPMLEASR